MKPCHLSLQSVTVDQADIAKMLACYDSGMFDVTTSNAVALALKRLLKPGHPVRVLRDSGNQLGFLQVGGHKFDLPEELLQWLARAEQTQAVEPISFRAALPDEWLIQPMHASLPVQPKEPMANVA